MKRNDALLAKVRAMLGRRLLPADYTRMMALPDVKAVARALAEHPAYAGIAPFLREGTLHRDYIESLLRQEYYEEFARLIRYLDPGERELVSPVVWKYEITEILLCLYATREPAAFLRFRNERMDPFCGVDAVRLAAARTPEELLAALRGTGYAETLSPLARNGTISYREAENALYADYYKKYVRLIREKAPREARAELEQAVFLDIDCLNLARVLRLRRYFDLKPQEIVPYLITPYGRLDARLLGELMNAPEEAWDEILRETPFAPPRNGHPTRSEDFDELLWEQARKTVRFTRYAPTAVLAYLRWRETELKNVITLIESKRYKLETAAAFSHLIGVRTEERGD